MIEAAKLAVTVESNALKVSGEVRQLGQSVKQAGEEGAPKVGMLEKAFGGLQASLGRVIAPVAMLAGAVKVGFDFAEEGASIKRLEGAANDLATSMGGNMEEITAAIEKASGGTVSQMNIMRSASRAMMLGLGTDADKLANLMEVAALRGRAMGLSTTQAFNDIVTGVGRMSPMILDNLGIVIDAETTMGEYAESLGKTAEQLTSAEKRQALLNSVLEEGNKQLDLVGGLSNDAATAYEKLNANWQNFTDNVKTWLAANTDLATALNVIAFGGQERKRILDDFNNTAIEGSGAWEDYAVKMIEANQRGNVFGEARANAMKDMVAETAIIRDLEDRYGVLDNKKLGLLVSTGQLTEAEANAYMNYQSMDERLTELLEKYGIYTEAQYEAEKASRDQAAAQVEQQTATEATTSALERQRLELEQVKSQSVEAMGQLIEATKRLEDAQKQWGQGAGQDVVTQLEQSGVKGSEYAEALGAVDEVMGTAFTTQMEYNNAVKDLVKEYKKTGDLEEFKKKLGELKDTYAPLTESIRDAKDEVWRLKQMISKLESKRIKIYLDIIQTENGTGQPSEDTNTDEVQKEPIGGSYLARRPTVLEVGDAGPELVQVLPLNSPSSDIQAGMMGMGDGGGVVLRNFGTIIIQNPSELANVLEELK